MIKFKITFKTISNKENEIDLWIKNKKKKKNTYKIQKQLINM